MIPQPSIYHLSFLLVEITLPPVDVEANLGETVSFICQAQVSSSIVWTVNGEHLTHSNDFFEPLETALLNESSCLREGRLLVHALPPVDNTTIVCVALSFSLNFGAAFSSPVKITVTGKEELRSLFFVVYNIHYCIMRCLEINLPVILLI